MEFIALQTASKTKLKYLKMKSFFKYNFSVQLFLRLAQMRNLRDKEKKNMH